jgi:hypothetical protein
MHPSTHQTALGASVAGLPAGSAGLFATFWDDAWHTDLGRDQATIPPHLLLYASMATIGAVIPPVTADSADDWAALPPRRLLARRAGQTVTGTLTATGHCRYAGQVGVPAIGTHLVPHAARTRGAATHGGGVGHRRAPAGLGP